MKKTLKSILISVMSLGVIGLLTSCPNPNGTYPESTNWFFVNQSEVDKLLKSPETLEFEGKRYKLEIYFDNDQYHTGRGCVFFIFKCNSSFVTQKRGFRFLLRDYIDNTTILETDKLKATDLWIINTNKEFYFLTKKINHYGNNLLSMGNTEAPQNYTFTVNTNETLKDSGAGIMRFETKEKEFFIKIKSILRGQ